MATIRVLGASAVQAKLVALSLEMPLKVASALYKEAVIDTNKSKKRTPVDTGALRDSHKTWKPEFHGREISSRITVGGPAAPYAVHVHENLEAQHPVGQAKFLESVAQESSRTLLGRLAKRLKI